MEELGAFIHQGIGIVDDAIHGDVGRLVVSTPKMSKS